jgi:outer membrane protein TolC
MRKTSIILFLLLLAFFSDTASFAQDYIKNELSISDIVQLVLENDSTVKISEQNLTAEYNFYRGILSDIYPQIDFSGGYGLDYETYRDSGNVDMEGYTNNSISTSLSLSQLIPTFGTLTLNLNNTMNITGMESADSESVDEPSFSQNPSITLTWEQPVFINGSFIDTDLYKSTFNKSRIGLLTSIQDNRIATNTAVYDALSLVSTITGLKDSIALKEESISLMNKHLTVMERNLELGLIPETDVWELKIDIGTEKELLLNLKYSLIQSQANLKHILNIDYDAEFEESFFNINLSTASIRPENIQNNPELQKLWLSAEDARLTEIINGNKNSPTMTTSFRIAPTYPSDRMRNLPSDFSSSFSDFFDDDAGTEFSLKIELNVPLYNGRKRTYTENEDTALLNIAEEKLKLKAETLIIEYQSLLIKRENIEEKLILLKDNIDLIDSRVEIMRKLLEVGETTDMDLIEVEIDLLEKVNELKQAQAELFITDLDLLTVAGIDLGAVFLGDDKIVNYIINEDNELVTESE